MSSLRKKITLPKYFLNYMSKRLLKAGADITPWEAISGQGYPTCAAGFAPAPQQWLCTDQLLPGPNQTHPVRADRTRDLHRGEAGLPYARLSLLEDYTEAPRSWRAAPPRPHRGGEAAELPLSRQPSKGLLVGLSPLGTDTPSRPTAPWPALGRSPPAVF